MLGLTLQLGLADEESLKRFHRVGRGGHDIPSYEQRNQRGHVSRTAALILYPYGHIHLRRLEKKGKPCRLL